MLMPSLTVRISWQSFPYGWLLHWLDEEGRYAADLRSSSPPYIDLCAGSLDAVDATKAWFHVQALMASVKTEPAISHSMPYTGFVSPISVGNANSEVVVPYFYYPRHDNRKSTMHYVNLVLIIDAYMKKFYNNLVVRDDLWK